MYLVQPLDHTPRVLRGLCYKGIAMNKVSKMLLAGLVLMVASAMGQTPIPPFAGVVLGAGVFFVDSAFVFGDFDGDGGADVFVHGYSAYTGDDKAGFGIYSYKKSAYLYEALFPRDDGNSTVRGFASGDLDGDGLVEVINRGIIYHFGAPSPAVKKN